MRIEFKGNSLSSLTEWKNLVFTGQKVGHWEEGRSALSLADFIINKNGTQRITDLISPEINENFTLDVAHPEYEARFDAYGHGREHDLGIFGKTESGRKVFVGVEAKVDESFGSTIASAYHNGKALELNGENTNAPVRIEELLKFNFKTIKPSDFRLRYQLLYSTAGTLCIEADIHVLLILVFKTNDYNAKKGAVNYKSLQAFLKRTEANKIIKDTHKVNMNNKDLTIIYKEVNL